MRIPHMRGIIDEIRAALRGFIHTPLFTFVAVASLALGIGANSAIFSLIDQVILKTLPVERPGELVQLYQSGSHYGSNNGPRMTSYPMYKDFRDQSPVHVGMIARREISTSLTYEGVSERTGGELVSGNYFEVLGVKAYLGRLISPTDDVTKGGHPVAVLGYDFWKNRFSSDPSIVGKEVLVNNNRLTVIGVSSPDYFGLDPTRVISIRMPIAMKAQMTPGWDAMEDRRSRWVQVFARLKPGVGIIQAQAQLQTQFSKMRQMEVQDAAFATAAHEVKDKFLKGRLELEEAANGYSGMRRQLAQPLWILMGIVALVLLIACTNVANLLIARSIVRRKEFAVRAALGASRWRLMRPLLVESTLLSCLGGGAGLALAYSLNSLLISFLPPANTPLRLSSTPDWRVLAFTFGIAFVTGILFGLFPAISAGNTDAAPALKEEGRGMSTGSSGFLRKALVGVQVALSILLLIAAGLFVRTLQNLKLANTGLVTSRLVTFQADPAIGGYSVEKIKQLIRDFKQRAEASPGVQKVGVGNVAKMSGNEWDSTVTVEGYKHEPGKMPGPYFDSVTPGYVEAMGMKILEGRDFRDSDANSEASGPKTTTWRVCMINKKFADTYFAGRSPIG
ncbi:MAG: ABC transporter permease, partial [Acidobacteria bacterium]|nr:ABC transporter permease [Acidobacteriota bacterium]